MPSYEEDYKQIAAAQQRARENTMAAGEYSSGAVTFEDDVMKGVQEHRAQRGVSMLGQSEADVMSQLPTSGPNVRARTEAEGAIVNPMTVDQITAQERGDLLGQLARIANYMNEQEGTISSIIGAGANKLLAAAKMKEAEAAAAQYEADNLYRMVQMKQEQEQREWERQFSESGAAQEQANWQAEFGLKQQTANTKTGGSGGKSGSGGGGGSKSKYTDEQIAEYANAVASKELKLTNIPMELRGKVNTLVGQIQEDKKKNSWSIWGKGQGWVPDWIPLVAQW